VTGTLLDFSNSDTVLFAGVTFGAKAQVSLSGNTLQVFDQNGTLDGTFTLQRSDIQAQSLVLERGLYPDWRPLPNAAGS
jgi:hypothetical protein